MGAGAVGRAGHRIGQAEAVDQLAEGRDPGEHRAGQAERGLDAQAGQDQK
ncbi:hypothetical protein Shyhy01_17050 [Streptomyces hygroscopicus subsp. hygroscopicus]|nr:hypothetical protein Shyhy01_17050 [Streptomyces hygroscopicus subsp. hygroscopicus]